MHTFLLQCDMLTYRLQQKGWISDLRLATSPDNFFFFFHLIRIFCKVELLHVIRFHLYPYPPLSIIQILQLKFKSVPLRESHEGGYIYSSMQHLLNLTKLLLKWKSISSYSSEICLPQQTFFVLVIFLITYQM